MTRPTEFVDETRPRRNTTVVGGTVVGGGPGAAGDVPTANGDGTATWGPQDPGITDHGDLTGLVPDDDHTQYVLRSILTTRGDLFRRGASVIERVALGADGRLLASDGTDAVWEAQYASIVVVIDGGASAITTGVKCDIRIPFNCVIERASLLADQTGSIVIDVWVDTYANYPPTVADTITASAKPTLSSAIKASDITLTGWTTTLAEGSTIRFNVDSAATLKRVTLELRVRKT